MKTSTIVRLAIQVAFLVWLFAFIFPIAIAAENTVLICLAVMGLLFVGVSILTLSSSLFTQWKNESKIKKTIDSVLSRNKD